VIVNYSEYIYVCVIVGNYDCDSWGRFGERARESKRNGKRKGKKIIGDEDRTVVYGELTVGTTLVPCATTPGTNMHICTG
jgi:hypothetical protein